jgi:ABC-type Zn uptake system ZnuABC Zn-binding protein ZnuA
MNAMRTISILCSLSLVLVGLAGADARPVAVCATTPELGSLVRTIGGPDVSVTVFAKATEDPHYVEPRLSFVTTLADADLVFVNGMELEVGWLPPLLRAARNASILPGASGYVDASAVISPLEVPRGAVDRSMGDMHPRGNPHYLTDPLNGLRVAALVRDRVSEVNPAVHDAVRRRYDEFRGRLGTALVGETLARKYDVEKLAELQSLGRLADFLRAQGDDAALGGWLGLMRPHGGVRAVQEHRVWVYFARRFGIEVIGEMEPKPGIPPTTKHLRQLVERMRAEHVGLILTAAYYDPRHARFLADQTGAAIVPLANQVGAREGTDDYLSMIDHNVRAVVTTLAGG